MLATSWTISETTRFSVVPPNQNVRKLKFILVLVFIAYVRGDLLISYKCFEEEWSKL